MKQEEYEKGIIIAHGVKGYYILRFTEIGESITIGRGKEQDAVAKRAAKIAAKMGLEYFGRKYIPGL